MSNYIFSATKNIFLPSPACDEFELGGPIFWLFETDEREVISELLYVVSVRTFRLREMELGIWKMPMAKKAFTRRHSDPN